MKRIATLLGHASPRIAPPVPARSDIAGFRQVSEEMGVSLMPWQDTAGRYLTAIGPDDRLLYREVCVVCARQNGKTTLMKPYIIRALRAGKRIMHIAQNRELPRHMFGVVADGIVQTDVDLLPKRRGKTIWPRYGSGQEEIVLTNGGVYRIAAAGRGGARGFTNDIVIIDELREMETTEVIGAVQPTLMMSDDPQMIYLSNAGTDQSVVLNAVRDRAGKDDALAYLEWSAAPERMVDDREGWEEANPALGHFPSVLQSLEHAYTSHRLAGTLALFETENLCRWVVTTRERIVDEYAWSRCEGEAAPSRNPAMAISMDPDGTRAAAAIAWQAGDSIAMRLITSNVTGNPIETDLLGPELKRVASRLGVREVAYDPLTDAELAKHFKKTRKVTGSEYANASSRFVTIVNAGKLVWSDAAEVTDDLMWTARKPHDESGSFQAVRAKDDRPIPAALAAIRAVYLASGPKPPTPRVM